MQMCVSSFLQYVYETKTLLMTVSTQITICIIEMWRLREHDLELTTYCNCECNLPFVFTAITIDIVVVPCLWERGSKFTTYLKLTSMLFSAHRRKSQVFYAIDIIVIRFL